MVSLINISNQLACNADLSECCTCNRVNKWSFKKPVNDSSMTELDVHDFYDLNDGFNLYTYSSMATMLYELQHENIYTIWRYDTRTAPYRLTDFDGYQHYATPLCNLTWETDNGATPGSTLRLYCTDFEEMVAHWAYFEGVRSWVDIVLLFYPSGTQFNQGGTTGFYVYKVKSMVDYDGGGNVNFTVPSSLSAGQYEIRMCLSTATSSMSDGQTHYWNQSNTLVGTTYALPHHTQQIFTVNSGGGGGGGGGGGQGTSTDYFSYLDFDFYGATYEYNSLQINNLSFTNYIVIGTACDKTFNLYVEYWYDNSASPVRLGWASRTLNENDMPWATININYRDTIYTITDANLDDRIAVRAVVSVTVNNTTQTKTITTTIEKE